jgi:hypothetical protein
MSKKFHGGSSSSEKYQTLFSIFSMPTSA